MKLKILIITFILIFATVTTLCVQEKPEPGFITPTPKQTPVEIKIVKIEEPIDSECLRCHYNEKRTYVPQADKIAGHLDASHVCIYCHVKNASELSEKELFFAVHSLHTSKYEDCSMCHKTYTKEDVKCGKCHAAKFEPSNGNIFAIHSLRDVGCRECHGYFMPIHIEKKIFPKEFSFPE
jgi:hypothetical protein